MSELIPSACGRKQPVVFLSGPSFAKEVLEQRPTGLIAACSDADLGATVQVSSEIPT
jgi:glycerol-3-phosphate dehydrogenase (NAD+)